MSKMNKPRPRLGRGLSSLIPLSELSEAEAAEIPDLMSTPASTPSPPKEEDPPSLPTSTPLPTSGPTVIDLPVGSIVPNPHQPRREFSEASIAELAASLKSTGLIQPIIVRRTDSGYELIAGERRLRAAKVAGFATLPALVKVVDGFTQAQMALIENIQREDLNPIDRALAYQMLVDQLGLTQSELAARLGQDRSAIAHYLRLLDLAEPVREWLRQGKLTLGHGKVLAGVPDAERQKEFAGRVVSQGLSIQNLQRMIEGAGVAKEGAAADKPGASAHIKDLETSLSRQLQMQVRVKWNPKNRKGKVVISYSSLDEFDRLKERLGVVTD